MTAPLGIPSLADRLTLIHERLVVIAGMVHAAETVEDGRTNLPITDCLAIARRAVDDALGELYWLRTRLPADALDMIAPDDDQARDVQAVTR